MSRFSSGLFFNVPVKMKCRKDVTPTTLLVRECVFAYADAKENQINTSQFSRLCKMLFISLHVPPLLLPPPLLFALFLLFYNLCKISHLHNFWRTRIWLINLSNKDRPLQGTCRQPFHGLNWRSLVSLHPRSRCCSLLRSLVLLTVMLKISQSKNQVYETLQGIRAQRF